MDKTLEMKFEPGTIKHLGIQMYSSIPHALSELVANSHDADATEVIINLFDSDNNKSITIRDNGTGLNFDEINDKFLRIGRERRDEEREGDEIVKSPVFGRVITGKKGLGKLALFGIGKKVTIVAKRKEEKQAVRFILDWSEIEQTKGKPYSPKFEFIDVDFENGIIITLTELKRKTGFNIDVIIEGIAKLFNFSSDNFGISIVHNSSKAEPVEYSRRYKSLTKQFSWKVENLVNELESTYEHKCKLKGEIISTEKPMKPNYKGITLYANGRLVNSASFFGLSEAGHFYSYVTGWINVDFIDDMRKELISTDRQSLVWDEDETVQLKEVLQEIVKLTLRKWNEERKKFKHEKIVSRIKEKTGRDIGAWVGSVSNNEDVKRNLLNSLEEIQQEAPEPEKLINFLHYLVPEYVEYHYRYFHEEVKGASETYYQKKDYYQALTESCIRYVNHIRNKVKLKGQVLNDNDYSAMGEAFGKNAKLLIMEYLRNNNLFNLTDNTINNLEEAQKFLSMGVICGYRNPLAHTEKIDLHDSGIITEKHCLDALALLSLLFERLDKVQ